MSVFFPKASLIGVALLAAGALVGGCSRHAPPAGAVTGTPASAPAASSTPTRGTESEQTPALPLSEAERSFGVSPTFNKDVKYQPDVIVMEHGADAIRANSSNGVTWTLDANAPHATEIRNGKILFATGRAVGRVLAVERKGDTLDVTLGPAELTDIFEELHISYHGTLDPSKMIAYYAPDAIGTYTDLNAPEQPSAETFREPPAKRLAAYRKNSQFLATRWDGGDGASLRSAVLTDADRLKFGASKVSIPIPNAYGPPVEVSVNDYKIVPNTYGGLGCIIKYDKDGIKFQAVAAVIVKDVKFDMSLDILHGMKNAFIDISGVGGLRVSISGGNQGAPKNLNAVIQIPVDFSFPIPGIGAPFSIVLRQSIKVETIFTTQGAVLEANGEYLYQGAIRAGIRQGQPVAEGPQTADTKTDLAATLTGHSLGVNALLLAYGGKVIAGLGAFSFAVGPYAAIDASIGTTRGADEQSGIGYICRRADVLIWMEAGVGLALPATTMKAINSFLSLFHVGEIPATYTKALLTKAIYKSAKAIPPACAKD